MAELLEVAAAGDKIDGDQLQDSIDALRAMANALDDAADSPELDVKAMQELGRQATKLRDGAGALVSTQIDLLAGEAKITAEHINSAVKAADDVIKKIADIKAKLEKVGALIEFLAAVATGNGKVILQAAVSLKGKLA